MATAIEPVQRWQIGDVSQVHQAKFNADFRAELQMYGSNCAPQCAHAWLGDIHDGPLGDDRQPDVGKRFLNPILRQRPDKHHELPCQTFAGSIVRISRPTEIVDSLNLPGTWPPSQICRKHLGSVLDHMRLLMHLSPTIHKTTHIAQHPPFHSLD